MDTDSLSYGYVKETKELFCCEECEDPFFDISNILQPTRIRYDVSVRHESNWFLLGNRFYLLFHISPIFWIIFYLIKKGN